MADRVAGVRGDRPTPANMLSMLPVFQALVCMAVVLATLLCFPRCYAQVPQVQTFGIGSYSCAKWTTNPQMDTDAHGWVLGFWSASNNANEKNHLVGHTTDAVGIFEEVRVACKQHPSASLFQIESEVYFRLMNEGR